MKVIYFKHLINIGDDISLSKHDFIELTTEVDLDLARIKRMKMREPVVGKCAASYFFTESFSKTRSRHR